MKPEVGALLESSGAILRGHFLLTSGRHSAVYFEKFRLLEQPGILSEIVKSMLDGLRAEEFDLVAGPTTGGIIIAFEVGRQWDLPTAYVETENGVRTLRRGKTLPPGARVLLVDDVLTTGTSLRECKVALEAAGAELRAAAVLIDRSEQAPDLGVPVTAAHRVVAESYAEHEVPAWLASIPVTKPGTRSVPVA